MKDKNEKRYEVDLYTPIQHYFAGEGYEVYGEVNHCDMIAVKDDELIIIELKLQLSVDLLIQATKRQRLSELVYIAIPQPKYSLRSKKWKDIIHLIRRLELGLIVVSFQKNNTSMDIKIHPAPFDRVKSMKRSKKKRENLLTEMKGRHGDYNVGGSNQTKIMTAYKENCIHIACCLERFGLLSPKDLRQMGTGEKTLSILNKNYYGWFDRIRRGTYSLSEAGISELKEYPELVTYYANLNDLSKKV
ncbi:DUF2161 domain-containing phosphodiesterase [Pseudalkalibacillus decolorationis]|uniref:DUF2161 domain-containing phosphodiesterase n=1 Tax=Pseudalkalibacillus decolorationis TaxID=163879 RepID=UPI00214771BC|nr:DUF2161 family putative PD-(D/E)XK-type phosphodiesterase [Pseudalkalibacillus decolorationis]